MLPFQRVRFNFSNLAKFHSSQPHASQPHLVLEFPKECFYFATVALRGREG
jgi:hypothetical protein